MSSRVRCTRYPHPWVKAEARPGPFKDYNRVNIVATRESVLEFFVSSGMQRDEIDSYDVPDGEQLETLLWRLVVQGSFFMVAEDRSKPVLVTEVVRIYLSDHDRILMHGSYSQLARKVNNKDCNPLVVF